MERYTKKMWVLSTAAVIALTGCGGGSSSSEQSGISDAQKSAVLATYADTATQSYTAAYNDVVALKAAIDAFVGNPTDTTLQAAKEAWLASRESYGVTEIFRLSNGPIDAEEGWVADLYGAPEGQINAWPLDENMIDYTEAADGSMTGGNIIDTAGEFTPTGGTAVDVTTITAAALTELNENGGDANVATGYHAIEFLLWGQDQDYNSFMEDTVTNGADVAGQRPIEDFTSAEHADRRIAYLQATSEKLSNDLATVTAAWEKTASADCDTNATGCYRAALLGQLTGDDAAKNIVPDTALKTIMAGMGVFIKSELANERIAVAVLTPSEEDEHSCFSDNTHRDIALNYQGFVNVLKGEFDGESMGTSMYALADTQTKADIDSVIASIDSKVATVNSAAATVHFDYQIKEGSDTKTDIVAMKNEMRDLGDEMVDVAKAFGISLSEGDVTDPEETQI